MSFLEVFGAILSIVIFLAKILIKNPPSPSQWHEEAEQKRFLNQHYSHDYSERNW